MNAAAELQHDNKEPPSNKQGRGGHSGPGAAGLPQHGARWGGQPDPWPPQGGGSYSPPHPGGSFSPPPPGRPPPVGGRGSCTLAAAAAAAGGRQDSWRGGPSPPQQLPPPPGPASAPPPPPPPIQRGNECNGGSSGIGPLRAPGYGPPSRGGF